MDCSSPTVIGVTCDTANGYSGTPSTSACTAATPGVVLTGCLTDDADIDCEVTWDECTAACESASERTYTIVQAQVSDGAACPNSLAEDCTPGNGECVGEDGNEYPFCFPSTRFEGEMLPPTISKEDSRNSRDY